MPVTPSSGPRPAALALALALALLPVTARAQAADAVLAKARDAVKICQDHLPDFDGLREAIKGAGYADKGVWGKRRVNLYAAPGLQLFMAASIASAPRQGCIVGVSRMTTEQAVALIAPWLAMTKAQPVAPVVPRSDLSWRGSYANAPVRLDLGSIGADGWKGSLISIVRD
ncbi:MAG: hypothetical protein QM699_15200 [Amaricoccus sp.]|uniref:hypothetical protein n=1 Tax=Amaricoccus sp. TaxID=1872485 RepID=UPI0039E2656E